MKSLAASAVAVTSLVLSAVTPGSRPLAHSTSAPRREIVIVFIGASSCCEDLTPSLRGPLDTLLRSVGQQALRRGAESRSVGVSIDWEPEDGWNYLKQFGRFDEVAVGSNWFSLAAETLMWRDSTAQPIVPQVVVYEHDVADLSATPRFGPRRVLKQVLGEDIIVWARAGSPLP